MAFILIRYLFTFLCTEKCQATLLAVVRRRGEKHLCFQQKWIQLCYFNKMETFRADNSLKTVLSHSYNDVIQ